MDESTVSSAPETHSGVNQRFSPFLRLFKPDFRPPGHLWPRWIFLRCLGLIYFSAFYSFIYQINGLIGPKGILPAHDYLQLIAQNVIGGKRYWIAPSLVWLGSGKFALLLLCWLGLIASILVVVNFWPRLTLLLSFVSYLSLVAVLQDFASYQSDSMLLGAGFISLFFAPPGVLPDESRHPPSRASLFMLQWLWFQIYFESGVAKIISHDPEWRHLTAMDHYYENGPLPTWIGWYVQQLPHAFHAFASLFTLIAELGLVWMVFLPRRFRIICFWIVTPFQIGIILTANYTFLNYLVLSLGFLLLDDRVFQRAKIGRWFHWTTALRLPQAKAQPERPSTLGATPVPTPEPRSRIQRVASALWIGISALMLTWIFYATADRLLGMFLDQPPLPTAPVAALEPFRIADQYGLFAVMTTARYEIEFQGSIDGTNWTPYPFRYKPQDMREYPRIYAPYQPRFDWNLWFASLAQWRQNPWVVRVEEALLVNNTAVLSLFRSNPFAGSPPRQVRAVLWQYWFTDFAEKRRTGQWWRREYRSLYAPALERTPDGRFSVISWPENTGPALP